MPDIQVVLQPCQPFYRPGETITGYVIVELSKPKKINKVCLEAYGRAYVSFWARHEEKNESCTDEKIYLKTHLTLWDKHNAGGQKEMPAGKHQYPFSVTIPYDAPPSVDIHGGNIRYSLKAELDIPWAIDKHHNITFTVGASIDANYAPMYGQPQSACIQKTGLFSSSNPMHATISIPRLAWAAGEIMPIDCNVTNNSSNDISGIEVKIIRNEFCTGHMVAPHYHQRTQENFKNVTSKRIDICIPASSSKQFQIDFGIPPDLVTIMNCPILSIKYELKIELHTKGILSTCPSTCLPIIFFNVPITHSPQYAQPAVVGFQPPPALPQAVIPQPPYSQPPYSQPPYSQPPYSQPPYSQPPYSQPPYSQPPYSQPYPNYPVPPATGQGTVPSASVPQYNPYPSAPLPYPSNPPIGGANTSPGEYPTLSYKGTL